MKPNYEKPIAMPLGEAAKGSGQCNVGSAVIGGAGAVGSVHCSTGGQQDWQGCTGDCYTGLLCVDGSTDTL